MDERKLNFEMLLGESLTQIEEYANGDSRHVRIVAYDLTVMPEVTPEVIKMVRKNLGATQRSFSYILGVSPRTIEAWEIGRSKPNGTAIRFLQLLSKNDSIKEAFKKELSETNH